MSGSAARDGERPQPKGWALGQTNPSKVIHKPNCRYAKRPYNHLGGMTDLQVATHLVKSGGWQWHKVHEACAPVLARTLTEMVERVLGAIAEVASGSAKDAST